jgi:hypothetical protein
MKTVRKPTQRIIKKPTPKLLSCIEYSIASTEANRT